MALPSPADEGALALDLPEPLALLRLLLHLRVEAPSGLLPVRSKPWLSLRRYRLMYFNQPEVLDCWPKPHAPLPCADGIQSWVLLLRSIEQTREPPWQQAHAMETQLYNESSHPCNDKGHGCVRKTCITQQAETRQRCSGGSVAVVLVYCSPKLPATPHPNTPTRRLQSNLGQPRSKIAFADGS